MIIAMIASKILVLKDSFEYKNNYLKDQVTLSLRYKSRWKHELHIQGYFLTKNHNSRGSLELQDT